ncbi:MAG TPA: cupin domain-containing protein [Desulfuromonadales bacterium]|nr:cupin domain-containing protein [Desulfuromonadales bacterium]
MSETEPVVIHEDECDPEGWDDPLSGHFRWRTLISQDRTSTDSLTVGVAEIDAGASKDLPLHRHEQVEVYYVLAGEGVVSVSGTDYPVRPGSAVFLPSNAEHGVRNTGVEQLRLLYVFPADSFSQIQYDFEKP